jgi:hypothetical protein
MMKIIGGNFQRPASHCADGTSGGGLGCFRRNSIRIYIAVFPWEDERKDRLDTAERCEDLAIHSKMESLKLSADCDRHLKVNDVTYSWRG